MKINLKQLLVSAISLLVAIATVIGFTRNAALVGELAPFLRALILDLAVLSALIAVFPLNPLFRGRPGTYGFVVCLPAMVPALLYFIFLLPQQASGEIQASQLRSDLVTDGSSNGIVEVGFAYPIYTPTVSIRSQDLYTRQLNIFLRMIDANGGETLFRGVREQVPGSGLSVEASVQGLLSRNEVYLLNPLTLPPGREIQGRAVFVISNLLDGTSFIDALGYAYQAQFELRDPLDGSLVQVFPLNRI